jgi:hypothetical protein
MTQLSPAAQDEGQDKTGMSLEEVRTLLSRAHNVAIPDNDPLLMIVTILNAYLNEVQKLHVRHEKGLSRLMAEKTDAYVSSVNVAVDRLAASLSSASVEGIRKIFEDHAARLNAFRYAVHWAAAIVAVSALLNVAVFILRGMR